MFPRTHHDKRVATNAVTKPESMNEGNHASSFAISIRGETSETRCRVTRIFQADNRALRMTVLSTADEGKVLMDTRGEEIGVVTEVDVDEQLAYVEPDPGIGEAVIQGLGYGDADEDDIEVPADAVATVTDTELRVTVDL